MSRRRFTIIDAVRYQYNTDLSYKYIDIPTYGAKAYVKYNNNSVITDEGKYIFNDDNLYLITFYTYSRTNQTSATIFIVSNDFTKATNKFINVELTSFVGKLYQVSTLIYDNARKIKATLSYYSLIKS